MGWRARSEPEPEDDSGQSMMVWLLETYEAAGARSQPAQLVSVEEPSAPVGEPVRTAAAPMQALAVLERLVEPAPEDPAPAPVPALFAERRLERRNDCALAVAAATRGATAETALGEAVDISISGVQLVMDGVAAVGPIDLIVADVVVDARVVGHEALRDGRHAWHVHVLDADDAWLGLVDGR